MSVIREANGETTITIAERRTESGSFEHARDIDVQGISFPKSSRPMPEDASEDASYFRLTGTFAYHKGWVDANDMPMPQGVDRIHYFTGIDD